MALTEAAYYDFFRKIVLQPDGITLEADHTRDELTITRGAGVAFNPVEGTDSFEIDVDYSLYVPVGSTSVTLRDVNAGESNISITAGSNIVISRVSDNELEIIATVGGASKSISNISTTNPVVVTTTSSHSYTEGSEVTITDVIGMTEVNGNEYYMDILTGDTFALYSDPLLTTPVDGTAFTPYSTGGVATADYTAVKTMSGLTDTTITNPQNNDLIAYSNGIWINTNSITATLTGDVTGDVLGNVTGNLDGIVGGTTPAAGTFSTLRTNESEIILGLNAKSGATNVGYGDRAITIGEEAGLTYQDDDSIAIGYRAADDGIGQRGISIGANSGPGSALVLESISLGPSAQAGGTGSVAIGNSAQAGGVNNISIGRQAGYGQGSTDVDGAITIGAYTNQSTGVAANTITINATNDALNPVNNLTPNSFVVKPIRQTDGPYYLKYDATSGEITYTPAGDLTGSVFADDSTVLVDGVNAKIVGDVETASLKLSSTSPSFLITDTDGSGNGLTQTLEITKYLTSGYQIQALSNSGLANLHLRVGNSYNLSMYETSAAFGVPVIIGSGSSLTFEGASNDAFETTLAVVDPTADRTITLPDTTGNLAVQTTGGYLQVEDSASNQGSVGLNLNAPNSTGGRTRLEIGPAFDVNFDRWQVAVNPDAAAAMSSLYLTVNGDSYMRLGPNSPPDSTERVVFYRPLYFDDAVGNTIFAAEGAGANSNEVFFNVTNPTADRTITLPDASGTVALVETTATTGKAIAMAMVFGG